VIVQRERHVADRVREIESGNDPMFLRRFGDCRSVEQLAREKVYRPDHHHSEVVGMFLDKIENVFRSNGELRFARWRENERLFRIQPMMHDLRFDGVRVGRKSRFFH